MTFAVIISDIENSSAILETTLLHVHTIVLSTLLNFFPSISRQFSLEFRGKV